MDQRSSEATDMGDRDLEPLTGVVRLEKLEELVSPEPEERVIVERQADVGALPGINLPVLVVQFHPRFERGGLSSYAIRVARIDLQVFPTRGAERRVHQLHNGRR